MTERDDDREFRDLLAAVERLPKSVEPPRDLWPGIEARIAGQGKGGKGKGRILAFPRRWGLLPLAAAAGERSNLPAVSCLTHHAQRVRSPAGIIAIALPVEHA